MKTFLAVIGGLFATMTIVSGVCVAGYAGSRVVQFDEKMDLANDRLKVLLDVNGVNENVK